MVLFIIYKCVFIFYCALLQCLLVFFTFSYNSTWGLFLFLLFFGSQCVINSFLFAPLRLFPCLILGLACIYMNIYIYIIYKRPIRVFGSYVLVFGRFSPHFFFYCLAFNAFSYL